MSESNEASITPPIERQGFLNKISTKIQDLRRGYSLEELAETERIASGNITGDDIADERRRQLRGINIPEGASAMSASSKALAEIDSIKSTPGLENKERMKQDAIKKLEKWSKKNS